MVVLLLVVVIAEVVVILIFFIVIVIVIAAEAFSPSRRWHLIDVKPVTMTSTGQNRTRKMLCACAAFAGARGDVGVVWGMLGQGQPPARARKAASALPERVTKRRMSAHLEESRKSFATGA